ncbi:RNA polymerase sigma factor [uncultured Microscilla sp.]|uniref:RNA polymerase sigma factor n=1 Tax=uncultured Microscilla sp. TaxID=432653 RepID=UPI00260D3A81|nr:RNA polymerase sigma factor [uncultured Microscilla sp.]
MMDVQTYQDQFVEFRPSLSSYIYRLVAHHQNTEDIVQEAYIKAFQHLAKFRGESSFKTWVFAIATNLAKDFLKKEQRWQEDYQDRCREATYASQEIQQTMADIAQNSTYGQFVLREHIDYCFTCISKTLMLEEQVCVILKEVYAFKVREIEVIMELSEGQVKYGLANARARLRHIFDNRCSLINKNGACHQCSELNGMFNPKQVFAVEANKVEMVKAQDKANHEQLLNLRLQLIQSIDPINAQGFDLHNYMLENMPHHVK